MLIKKFLIIIFCLLITVSCTQQPEKPLPSEITSLYGTEQIENLKITSNDCKVRSGMGQNFNVIGTLDKGEQLDVIGQTDDWYIVKMDNNQIGAVEADDAKPVVEDTDPPQTNSSIKLTSSEQKMVDYINQERTSRNLQPLTVDLSVTDVARIKAQDMIDNNYFSHYSPTYGSPFDMLKSYGINYLQAGENLAGNSSIDNAHKALMNSQGHRDNILNPDFTHIGVGVKSGGQYGNMIVEMFISKPQ